LPLASEDWIASATPVTDQDSRYLHPSIKLLLRSAPPPLLDVTFIIPATACHQRNYL
jgi:hypothetical protein